jgi:CHAT domain-containing protein
VLDVGAADVRVAVRALRQALDAAGVARIEGVPRYPGSQAHKLYQQIFAPAEELLDGARLVFVVPNGALQSLPARALVTEAPTKPITGIEDYRYVPWLVKRYAVTVLPSVRSLKALRVFAGKTAAKRPFVGFGEPALVMKPPPTVSDDDDGLLTAGEIAHLTLNAHWVVLSACNTAAPDGLPGAEDLSGLARAFFYAGSRASLVSHWPVDSEAATRLTTRLF